MFPSTYRASDIALVIGGLLSREPSVNNVNYHNIVGKCGGEIAKSDFQNYIFILTIWWHLYACVCVISMHINNFDGLVCGPKITKWHN